jgi:hypothetical protein
METKPELIDKNFKKCVEGYHLITPSGKKNETKTN